VGLVDYADDFGSQERFLRTSINWIGWPLKFIESGWDVQALLKTMVMSGHLSQASKQIGISPCLLIQVKMVGGEVSKG